MDTVNLAQKFSTFSDHWSPKIVADLNDSYIELVIPKGVEHMPVADEEAQVILIEPKTTVNTGNVQSERTVAAPQRI